MRFGPTQQQQDPNNYLGLLTGDAAPLTQSASQFGAAPSGYGSMYDQLFAANPYRKQTYNQTGWQKFLSSLGFRTKYDDWLDQTSTQIAEYDAGIISQIQQDQYNSPAAMAFRERAAGINPDLAGIGDVASAAGPIEDANGMTPSESTEPSLLDIGSFVVNTSQSVLGLIPSVLSFATNIKQMKGLRLENDMKELQFGSQAVDAAQKFFIEGITPAMYREAYESNDWTNILNAAKKDARYLSDTFFSDRRARKRFNLAYGMHSNSLMSELQKYKTYDEFEKHRKSLLSQRASTFFSDDDETMELLLNSFISPIETYQKSMNDLNLETFDKQKQIRRQELDLKSTQLQNQQEYENVIDPSQQANAENEANEATIRERKIFNATNQLFEDIMTNLQQYDNWWSKLAMAFVGIARAQLLSGMHLQFGRNRQYTVDGDTGVLSESGRGSFGISF